MGGGAEITHDLLVTIGAFVCPDKLRPGNIGWGDDRAIALKRAAGEKSEGESVSEAGAPKQSQAVSVDPLNQCAVPHPGIS